MGTVVKHPVPDRVKLSFVIFGILAFWYGADVWPLTATLTTSLDAAHHRWQRSILGIS